MAGEAPARFAITRRVLLRLVMGTLIGAVAGGVMTWAYVTGRERVLGIPLLNWELLTVDARQSFFRMDDEKSPDITVVKIDEISLQRTLEMYGTAWPWNREIYSYIVDRLREAGARVVAFDIAFSADRIYGRKTGQDAVRIEDLVPQDGAGDEGDDFFGPDPDADPPADPDAAADRDESDDDFFGPDPGAPHTDYSDPNRFFNAEFARAVAQHGRVVVPLVLEGQTGMEHAADRLEEIYRGGTLEDLRGRLCKPPPFTAPLGVRPNVKPSVLAPFPQLREQVAGAGLVDRLSDSDGVERRAWLYTQVGDDLVCPDFAAAVWSVARGATPALDSQGFLFGNQRIARRPDGSVWIRWRGREENRFAVVNAESLIRATWLIENEDAQVPAWIGDYTEENIKDRIVLIGATGEAQGDFVPTPFDLQPGVFKQAAVLDMLLTGTDLADIPRWLGVLLILGLTLSATLAIALLFPTGTTGVRTATVLGTLGVLVGYLVVAFAAFDRGVMFPVFYVGFGIGSGAFWSFLYAFFFAARDRRALENKMRTYVSDKVMNRFLDAYERGDVKSLAAERVRVTVLFSDIAGFTSISERLDAEELVSLLNVYLSRMTDILKNDYDAYVDKYIGDAIMAVWGAPFPQDNQCVLAVRAALDNVRATDALADELQAKGLPRISARIGVNTGFAVVGETGSVERAQYTALGDTVNIGARLEGINKYYGTRIMLGAETYEGAKEIVVAREVDLVKVKGKAIAVPMYEPLAAHGTDAVERARALAARYAEPFELYKAGQFEEAARLFKQLLVDYPSDGPTQVMLKRIETFQREGAPSDWTGAWEMTEK